MAPAQPDELLTAHEYAEEGSLLGVQNAFRRSTFGKAPDVDAVDHTGRTCLMLAAENGHENIVQFLLQNHANVEKTDPFNKRSAIHLAARKLRTSCWLGSYAKGYLGVLKLLLAALTPERRDEAINEPDAHGLTPVYFAGTRGSNPECLRELISDGARYNSVKVSVKAAGNVMLAAMRLKKKAGFGGLKGPGPTEEDAPAAEEASRAEAEEPAGEGSKAENEEARASPVPAA